MKTPFHDLKIKTLEDGTIRLTQGDYCGEEYIVDLHPAQITYMADCLLAITPLPLLDRYHSVTSPLQDKRIDTLERRLLWALNRFNACYAALPSDLFERCGDAGQFYAWLEASVDVLTEYCADIEGVVASQVSGDELVQSTATRCDSVLPEQRNADLFAEPENSAVSNAKEFLQNLLANGEVKQTQIEIERKGAGISLASVRRAKDELSVKSVKTADCWYWALPHNLSTLSTLRPAA